MQSCGNCWIGVDYDRNDYDNDEKLEENGDAKSLSRRQQMRIYSSWNHVTTLCSASIRFNLDGFPFYLAINQRLFTTNG